MFYMIKGFIFREDYNEFGIYLKLFLKVQVRKQLKYSLLLFQFYISYILLTLLYLYSILYNQDIFDFSTSNLKNNYYENNDYNLLLYHIISIYKLHKYLFKSHNQNLIQTISILIILLNLTLPSFNFLFCLNYLLINCDALLVVLFFKYIPIC